MAIEPEKCWTHERSSSPFVDRQKERLVRLSRKWRLSSELLSRYATLICTSHSGVRRRYAVSALGSGFLSGFFSACEAVATSPSPNSDQRKERRAGLRDENLLSEGAAITLSEITRMPGSSQ